MGQKHLWMNEGLSVYLEPIARTRIGILTAKEYWKELVEGLQNGQPEAGDKGLDQTHTWGRTYWGGTIFWFLIDLKIREQTHGKKSVDDVIKTILAAGGDGSVTWPMEKVLDMGDKASGTHAMHDVYNQLVPQAYSVDFGPIWKQLGVVYNNGNVTFDDKAPLAWLRKAITSPDGHGEERH
jgi:predicted metalloprotease with PDZ domain